MMADRLLETVHTKTTPLTSQGIEAGSSWSQLGVTMAPEDTFQIYCRNIKEAGYSKVGRLAVDPDPL